MYSRYANSVEEWDGKGGNALSHLYRMKSNLKEVITLIVVNFIFNFSLFIPVIILGNTYYFSIKTPFSAIILTKSVFKQLPESVIVMISFTIQLDGWMKKIMLMREFG